MTVKAIYPGTFDPVHDGHLNIMERGAAIFDHLVVGVFDHGRPSKSLLFSLQERVDMIEASLPSHIRSKITVMPYGGLTVDFAQAVEAKVILRGLRVFSDFEFEFRMALANQRLAPGIEVVTLISREEHTFLSGTTVREIASFGGDVTSMVPANVNLALKAAYAVSDDQRRETPISLRD